MKTILIGWGYVILLLMLFTGIYEVFYDGSKRGITIGTPMIVASITAALWLTDIIL